MKTYLAPLLRSRRRSAVRWLRAAALAACGGAASLRAQQALPKTADINFQVAADGSLDMAFQMTFDAANWRGWKAMVGDEPARMRAMMRHQFAAMTLEDFKLDRDDMNRVARMSMHSPSGPELREDGTLQVPVDGYFRLVNHAGRDWFFSGNNPNAGGTLNNVKVTLPASVTNAHVANADEPDQALVFALAAPASSSRWFYLSGAAVTLLGLTLLLVGVLRRKRPPLSLPVSPVQVLPAARPMDAAYPPTSHGPAAPVAPPSMSPPAGASANVPPPFQKSDPFNEPD